MRHGGECGDRQRQDPVQASAAGWVGAALPRVGLVGPLPPPSGGMAHQCQQLVRLLEAEGVEVVLACTNRAYWPAWVGRIPVLRALCRFLPYSLSLWRLAARVDVVHILANSGWAWHLFVAPAVIICRLRDTPVIINYRGGQADDFFTRGPSYVTTMLAKVSARVTPSVFLQRVFAKHHLTAQVISNVVDLSRFTPGVARQFGDAPHLIVTRNLEPIYDIATAIRAFSQVRQVYAGATMTVAGTGPELSNLRGLVSELQLQGVVRFAGRIDNAQISALYRSADCVLNASTVDNMPNAILEALASGVPVVSTRAGGIPDIVEHGVTGRLVPLGSPDAMAQEALHVLGNPEMADSLRQAGLLQVKAYDWPQVRDHWLALYRRVAASGRVV